MKKKGKVIICLFLTIYLIICTMTNSVAILALENSFENQENVSEKTEEQIIDSNTSSEEIVDDTDENEEETVVEKENDSNEVAPEENNENNNEQNVIGQENNTINESNQNNISFEKEQSIDISSVSLTAEKDVEEKYIHVTLKNFYIEDGSQVRFAIWSVEKVQDDLEWANANKQEDGTYVYNADISKHKTSGTYNIHAYVYTNGKMIKLSETTVEVSKPEVILTTTDISTGVFRIDAEITNTPNGLKKVQIPVWSNEDQSDIIWYTATENDENHYSVTVNISNHSGNFGNYYYSCYTTTNTGIFTGVENAIKNIELDSGVLSATANQKETQIQIKLEKLNLDGIKGQVRFAIWSEEKDQDDLEWTNANKQEDGTYVYNADISKHKTSGTYNIHAYVYTNGKMIKLSETTVEVSKPEVILTTTDISTGVFRIDAEITNTPNGLKKVQIPVWSNEDQSDIIWYTATENDENHYSVTVNISNHSGNFGNYYYSCYTTTNTGIFTGVENAIKNIELDSGVLSATANQKETQIQIRLEELNLEGIDGQVRFAIWSEEKDQDDLEWANANRREDGTYVYNADISKHKTSGTYNIHAYVYTNGKMIKLSETTVEVSKPEVILTTTDISTGVFRIDAEITNTPNGLKKVQIPVWSNEDQSDIIWYTATENDENHYSVTVNISNHSGNFGKYQYSCYTTTNTGIFTGSVNKSVMVEISGLNLVANVNEHETSANVMLSGVNFDALNGIVRFAIWSDENGQDDLIWYDADRLANNYVINFDIKNHKTFGKYFVHAYVMINDRIIKLSETEFSISKTATTNATISSESRSDGKFIISIQTSALSGIDKVEVPVWCDDNQNDIFWYTAQKTSENNYQVTVDITNHKYHYGDFKYHIYTTMGNGIRTNTYQSNYNFIVENYISVSRIGQGKYQVALHNPIGDNISSVLIPTWSKINDQDDLVWYTANNVGNNIWVAEISTRNHKNSGEFISHAYIVINGVQTNVAQKIYTIPQSDFLTGMDLKAQSYTSNTNYLILVDRSTHTVGVYHGSYGNWNKVHEYLCTVGAPSTPTVVGDFAIYRKGRYFDSGASRCFYYSAFYGGYYFHSVLYYKDNEPLRIMDGRLGMNLSHGCIRLQVDNAKWIYDNCPIGTRVIVYN